MAIAAVCQALVARLLEHPRVGIPSWRIAENRRVAPRHGLDGEFAELTTGERLPVRERLRALLDELEPAAAALGGSEQLAHARSLVDANGALRMREAAGGDPRAGARWAADRFLDGC
jgi:carboxylate-amine ligase